MKTPEIPIAKEGYPFCLFAAFVTLALAVLQYDLLALVALVMTALVVNFFRDPERFVPQDEDTIVSPADGRVILVEPVHDERFLKAQAYRVSIFMNVFNVHVNRVCFPGTVADIQYSPGRFYNAGTDRGGLENESCAVTLETANGQRLTMVQIAGLLARRIVCWTEKGDMLARGQRFGMIRFGSRVDLYLPQRVQIEVRVGQKVRAGESIIGYLPSA